MTASKLILALLLCVSVYSQQFLATPSVEAISDEGTISKVTHTKLPLGFFPSSFNVKVYNPSCPFPIFEEGMCAGNWAIAIADTLSDLICFAQNIPVTLSAQQLLDCVDNSYESCTNVTSTSNVQHALNYLATTGITNSTCYPYNSIFTGSTGTCNNNCASNSSIEVLYLIQGIEVFTNTNDTKTFLMDEGSVLIQFDLYDDLLRYNGGVYVTDPNAKYIGVHYGKVIGWNTDKTTGQQYWIVANSWGSAWGVNGYFNIFMSNSIITSLTGFNL